MSKKYKFRLSENNWLQFTVAELTKIAMTICFIPSEFDYEILIPEGKINIKDKEKLPDAIVATKRLYKVLCETE